MNKLALLFTAVLLPQVVAANDRTMLSEQALVELFSSDIRSEQDRARDAARQPAKVLAFAGIGPGDTVLDVNAGAGWYTELLSLAVGENGKVYLLNDKIYFPFAQDGLNERTKDGRLGNVERLDNVPIKDLSVEPGSLDLAFASLSYHDLFFTDFVRDGETVIVREEAADYRAALEAVHKALKNDGTFVVIDHTGPAGSGHEVPNTLHRIDPEMVKYQFAESGFKLIEQAYYLSNDQDDYSKSVFDPELRGKTDRFIFKFAKQ